MEGAACQTISWLGVAPFLMCQATSRGKKDICPKVSFGHTAILHHDLLLNENES